MGRGAEVGKAQDIANQQIQNADQQRQQMLQLLTGQLGKRDATLDPLLQQIISGQTDASNLANKNFDQGLGEAQNSNTQGLSEAELASGQGLSEAEKSAQAGLEDTTGLVSRSQQYADQGLSPEAQAALRTNQTDQIPGQFNNAQSQIQAALSRRGVGGGDTPGGGEMARQLAPLFAAKANAISGANRDTILQTEAAKRQGLTALASALAQRQSARTQGLAGTQAARNSGLAGTQAARTSGLGGIQNARNSGLSAILAALQGQNATAGTIGGIYNPSTFVSGADSALGSEGSATNTRTGLIKPSAWDYAAPILGAGIGAAGQGLTSGGLFNKGCWIAAELWGGWKDSRVILVRRWLHEKFRHTAIGKPLVALYLNYGEQMARFIQTHRRTRRVFQWLFNLALRKATKAYA
jgi:hypothetical protein